MNHKTTPMMIDGTVFNEKINAKAINPAIKIHSRSHPSSKFGLFSDLFITDRLKVDPPAMSNPTLYFQ